MLLPLAWFFSLFLPRIVSAPHLPHPTQIFTFSSPSSKKIKMMDTPMASSTPGSMDMSAVFNTATDTPLYSAAWMPRSPAGYAGTCIFLILFAALWRGGFAFKSVMERRWLDAAMNRRYVVVAGKQRESERVSQESETKSTVLLTERGVEEEVRVVRRVSRGVMPWRWSVDLPRALILVVLSGMGYLL